jgi:LmbE family N-acetylglucosaminyl deacetylase
VPTIIKRQPRMLSLSLSQNVAAPLRILCLGAHSDDIEIGCGGTLLQLLSRHKNVEVSWVVFSSGQERAREARSSAKLYLQRAKNYSVVVHDFRDSFFPFDGAKIKNHFEALKPVSPDIVFTHARGDAHQDHRLLGDLTWNTFRNHLILEYEIPKYDGDLGQPNFFVPLEKRFCERKVRCLIDAFATQRSKLWFREETFLALMRLRGMECIAPSGYAEAFYCRKVVI